jgi:hypothetical protein
MKTWHIRVVDINGRITSNAHSASLLARLDVVSAAFGSKLDAGVSATKGAC